MGLISKIVTKERALGYLFAVAFCAVMIWFKAADVNVGSWILVLLFGSILLAIALILFAMLAATIGRLLR